MEGKHGLRGTYLHLASLKKRKRVDGRKREKKGRNGKIEVVGGVVKTKGKVREKSHHLSRGRFSFWRLRCPCWLASRLGGERSRRRSSKTGGGRSVQYEQGYVFRQEEEERAEEPIPHVPHALVRWSPFLALPEGVPQSQVAGNDLARARIALDRAGGRKAGIGCRCRWWWWWWWDKDRRKGTRRGGRKKGRRV